MEDDDHNEGAIAKILCSKMPVLVLTEQTNLDWGKNFCGMFIILLQ